MISHFPSLQRRTGLSRQAASSRLSHVINTQGLRDYQVRGALWLSERTHSLLADEMRLGKTAQVLRSLPLQARAIIVCPAIVRLVWRNEISLWRSDLYPYLINKSNLRAPRLGEVLIISYDSLPEVPKGWQEALISESLQSVTLILDEVHYVKNDDALRTSRVRALQEQCGRVIGISGTPLVGSVRDLYGVLSSCGLSGPFKSARALENAAKRHETQDVASLLSECMLRRTRREVFPELPPKIYQTIPVEAPEDLREWLDEVTEAWDSLGEPNELPPFELVSEALMALARARTDAALELAEQYLEDGPLIVFSTHKEPVLAIGEELGASLVGEVQAEERADAVQAFQSGEIDLIALTMSVGGVGIDLSRASRILEVDLSWTPGVNAQAEDRAVRVDKREPIEVIRMVTDHPLDLRVLSILERKEKLIASVIGS